MVKKFTVYVHTCLVSNKNYVGYTSKTIEARWQEHVKAARLGKNFYISNAIRKHGDDIWRHIVLEIFDSKRKACESEIKWIAALESNNPRFGYNETSGGDGGVPTQSCIEKNRKANTGRRMSIESRTKISLALKGRKHGPMSATSKEKLRISAMGNKRRLGIPHTDIAKAKIGEASRRRSPPSQETRQKYSERNKRRWAKYRAMKNAHQANDFPVQRTECSEFDKDHVHLHPQV